MESVLSLPHASPPLAVALSDSRRLRLPAPQARWRHRLHWVRQALPGLVRRHGLRLGRTTSYTAAFTPERALIERFEDLFDLRHGPGGIDYPFVYAQGLVELLQGRVLADLGVNLRHVAPLRQRLRLHAEPAALLRGTQQLRCRLLDAAALGVGEVMLRLETRVEDDEGRLLATLEDGFTVDGLEAPPAGLPETAPSLAHALQRLRARSPEIDASAPDVRLRQLYVAPGVARRYRAVAGAPMVGRAGGVVPASYLRHLVSRELAEWGVAQDDLQLTFVGRALPGQTLCLLQQGRRLELVDASNRLVALGSA